MKKELDEALVKDFPNLYADRHGNPKNTCMIWGFPGDGWESIIRKLSEKIEAFILSLPEENRREWKAEQVKEKFGGLRFYMSLHSPEVESWIEDAEKKSLITCETCGAPGSLRKNGWWKIRCDDCEISFYKLKKEKNK